MSALPPEQMRTMRGAASLASEPAGSLAQKWLDLHTNAEQLASLARLSAEPFDARLAAFPDLLADAGEWQRDLASQGLEDIDAMMMPGMAALGAVAARGLDASAPAQALWREFHHAREAVLSLVQPQIGAEAT